MTALRFVDTNVLLYSASSDPRELEKTAAAQAILNGGNLAVSVQVLQEFYVQAVRTKENRPLTHDEAAALTLSFRRFQVQDMTVGVLERALQTTRRFGISYWDAAIIEAARSLGCETVLSEDLSHGQDYGGVGVENPFF